MRWKYGDVIMAEGDAVMVVVPGEIAISGTTTKTYNAFVLFLGTEGALYGGGSRPTGSVLPFNPDHPAWRLVDADET